MQPGSQTTRHDRFFLAIIFIIISFGMILRASKYLPGWSMRGDELSVTLNLLNRSAIDLATKPLDYEQVAPIGYLLTVKALISVFGPSEYVLRLTAFISGCLSLVLMYRLLNKTTGRYGILFSLLAFAFSYYLIYYSAELKQYSSDVLVSLVLALYFHRHISRETIQRDFWELGTVGTLAIIFSHPAIFMVIAMGSTLLIHYWKNKQKLIWITLVGMVWAGTFLIIYLMLLRHQTTSEYLITFWGNLNSYMPLRFWRNPSWFPDSMGHLFTNIGGLSMGMTYILIALYIYGLWLFWKEKTWQWAVVAVLPIGINMLVSGFEKFPFHGRLIMYLLPLVFVVFAKAVDGLTSLVHNKFAASLSFIALVIVLLRPALPTAKNFLFSKSYMEEDLKPVLSYIVKNSQSSDTLYLYHYASYQFSYYAPQYGFEGLNIVYGQDYSRNARKYQDELSSLPRGQRIWFLFTYVGDAIIKKNEKQNEREYIINYLSNNGSLVQEFYSTNDVSSAHLYILK
jgi:hypothetical protein